MQMDRLYPPGKVWWALRDSPDSSIYPREDLANESCSTPENIRLYEVLDVEKVFGQVIFAKDILRYASNRTWLRTKLITLKLPYASYI